MNRRRSGPIRLLSGVVVAGAVLSMAACGSSSSAEKASGGSSNGLPDQVRIYTCCVSGTEIPVWLAFDKGLFQKYGLKTAALKLIPPPTGGSALISGSVDIGNDAPSVGINATASGNSQLEYVAGKTSRPVFRIMSNKLTDASQIKGKRLGVSGQYAPPALAAYAYLKDKFGLVAGKDYTVVPSAKISDLVATLSNNSIDAAVLSTPLNLQAEKKGAHEIADLSGSVAEGNSYVVTTKSFAQKYPAAVEDYLKAIIDAMHLAKTDKAAAIASIVKHQTGITQSDAEQVYDDYINIFDPNMYADALQTYVKFPSTPQVGKVDVKSVMDDSFLKKLDQEGFLKSMGFTLNTSGVTPTGSGAAQ